MIKNNMWRWSFLINMLAIAIIGRLLPHPPDFSPIPALCLLLSQTYSKKISVFLMLSTIFISDILLAVINGYPWIGGWAFFTYSGYIICILAIRKTNSAWFSLFAMTLLFWVWSNFGVWITNFPYTLNGVISCYLLALPFLANSIVGGIVWYVVFDRLVLLDRTRLNFDKKIIALK